jgi:hypothetical protein
VDDQHQMVSAVSDQGAQSCNLVDVKISAGWSEKKHMTFFFLFFVFYRELLIHTISLVWFCRQGSFYPAGLCGQGGQVNPGCHVSHHININVTSGFLVSNICWLEYLQELWKHTRMTSS